MSFFFRVNGQEPEELSLEELEDGVLLQKVLVPPGWNKLWKETACPGDNNTIWILGMWYQGIYKQQIPTIWCLDFATSKKLHRYTVILFGHFGREPQWKTIEVLGVSEFRFSGRLELLMVWGGNFPGLVWTGARSSILMLFAAINLHFDRRCLQWDHPLFQWRSRSGDHWTWIFHGCFMTQLVCISHETLINPTKMSLNYDIAWNPHDQCYQPWLTILKISINHDSPILNQQFKPV